MEHPKEITDAERASVLQNVQAAIGTVNDGVEKFQQTLTQLTPADFRKVTSALTPEHRLWIPPLLDLVRTQSQTFIGRVQSFRQLAGSGSGNLSEARTTRARRTRTAAHRARTKRDAELPAATRKIFDKLPRRFSMGDLRAVGGRRATTLPAQLTLRGLIRKTRHGEYEKVA